MAPVASSATSLKEYLKRYEDKPDESNKKKKKIEKKKKKKVQQEANGVIVVDTDPVWQKQVKLDEESDESEVEERPQVNEDIEVKRMKRLELIREKHAIGAISEDGSGWVSVSETATQLSLKEENSDISPPRKRRPRNDTPSPEHGEKEATEFPPLRKRHYSPSPEPEGKKLRSFPPDSAHAGVVRQSSNIARARERSRHDSPSPEPSGGPGRDVDDLSPPRRQRKRQHSPVQESDLSPPRRTHTKTSAQEKKNTMISDLSDISPPRRVRRGSSPSPDFRTSIGEDLSPPRKGRKGYSPSRKEPSSLKQQPRTGLISGQDIKEENARTKKDDWKRYKDMNSMVSGRDGERVYRDKMTGKRISKEEFEKKDKKEEKPKEVKLEWGKGLAQKREAEQKLLEIEHEKDQPFARTRDDPVLEKMMKERVRWGDPMAHLVKRDQPILTDLGADEKMKSSGFVIPQEIPNHSWIKRGLDAAPNRYSIRPGRHWDGVDRSNGTEKDLFKRMNDRKATEQEAYEWSVADM
ncbi:BUD13 homolog [Impatiens glandulifera]|uniref:BUD13 homolog n=1 Tax=Impatiens glandulifera TaxID=253017 RepID=UPI001FB0EF55|nr:BUD13 homolog [Impatiens glandulifera]